MKNKNNNNNTNNNKTMENCEDSFTPWDHRELDTYLPDYDYQYDYLNLDDWNYPYHDYFYGKFNYNINN